ncbi:MAG: hypothetical protein IPO92_06840 [Saprospiraceae bacterium]|nr:hypothetical protein [Saprospiraceae bacterium]
MKEIKFKFFKGEGQWIYLPRKVEVFTSQDGKTFLPVVTLEKVDSDTALLHCF